MSGDIENTSTGETPERILQAARRLFAERGYGATPMTAIADEANVARATVYNNFDDKIDILATIIGRYMQGYVAIGDQLRYGEVASRSAFEKLEAMTLMALEWRIENRDLRGAIDAARHLSGSGWEAANAEADHALLQWIAQVHEQGQVAGLTHPDLDLSIATSAVYSMIESALSNFDVLTPRDRVAHVAHQLTLVHWHAIYCVAPDRVGPREA